MKVRLAIIGAGHLGKIHARLAQQHAGVSVVGVVDPVAPARQAIADELNIPTFEDFRPLLGDVDAAIIATPTTLHYSVARELLQHGIHLLIEKPFTSTAEQAHELVELAAERNLTIQVGHVERFNPALTAARPYLHDVIYIEATRTSGYACRSTDIGVILDLMIHDLDIAMWLADGTVRDVQAVGATVIGPHEDMVQARLTFSDGCVANLTASRTSHTASRCMRIFCRHHYLELDFAEKTAQLIAPSARLLHGVNVDRMSPGEKDQLRTRLFDDYLPITRLHVQDRNAILDEQEEFFIGLRTGRRPRISGYDARGVLRIAEQIRDRVQWFEQHVSAPGRRAWRQAG